MLIKINRSTLWTLCEVSMINSWRSSGILRCTYWYQLRNECRPQICVHISHPQRFTVNSSLRWRMLTGDMLRFALHPIQYELSCVDRRWSWCRNRTKSENESIIVTVSVLASVTRRAEVKSNHTMQQHCVKNISLCFMCFTASSNYPSFSSFVFWVR